MHILYIIGILTTLAALFAFINYHFLRLELTISLMLQSLVFSLLLILLMAVGFDIVTPAQAMLNKIDFNLLLLEGLLSYLLFAGALFVKNEELLNVKFDIGIYATAGVILSTFVVGGLVWWISGLLGLNLRPIYCFLFGALISPTDPVAVLPVLRAHGMPQRLNAQIAGEALFNDGIGIVLFLSLLTLTGSNGIRAGDVLQLFVLKTIGGLLFGGLLGWLGYLLMKSVDNYQLEILITLAMVSGGYSSANLLHVSGPLAMVIAGLLVGGPGRRRAMSERTRENLDRFWELVEELLNSILFTLIGLETLTILTRLSKVDLITAAIAVPLVLLGRVVSVSVVAAFMRCCGTYERGSILIMTWSGLRGGIPIALALSLPNVPERGTLLFATYVVVAFSILVQGGTLKYLVDWRVAGR